MKHITRRYRRLRVSNIKVAFIVIFLNIIMVPQYEAYKSEGNNLFQVYLNNEFVGSVSKQVDIEDLLIQARRAVAAKSDTMVIVEASLRTEGSEAVMAKTDTAKTVKANMIDVLSKNVHGSLQPAYTVKIGSNTFNLATLDDVKKVLKATVTQYDDKNEYAVSVVKDPTRELNALTASIVKAEEIKEEPTTVNTIFAGIEKLFSSSKDEAEKNPEAMSFDDYEYGLLDLSFDKPIEIVDAFLTDDQLSTVDEAIESITSQEDKSVVYKVQAGDTLSGISVDKDIPIDKIVALNPDIEDERTTIRIDQEILLSNLEPPLAINRVEREYVEEDYDADVVYVDNDAWYTTEKVVLQQPSSGHRKIVAQINYHNDKVESREVIKEEIVLEAVAKIVERGTKTPPTYIKPIAGGRLSSSYGRRTAPTKGASSNHQGVDWSVAKGTTVMASSGGTVTRAGWASGYGYVVFIKHPDGKETRYGHLSKVCVSVGQSVRQGEKIALSGNSGVSTGPHLHFEIRVNGASVNPLKYVQ